ncbi:MAG: hypothetical protein ABEJ58_07745 [Halodesulfurarchaeum sp.]
MGRRRSSGSGNGRGQTETIGFALIIAFTVLSVGALLVFGGAAVEETQQSIDITRTEHAMSQFDAQAAMVGLGRSDAQRIDLGRSGPGTYSVRPGAGWIRITHHNYSDGGREEVIYNESMGAVVYDAGDTEIAYQGGGVWRLDQGATMVSPPEFYYQGSTLTFPILQVGGSDGMSGNVQARITQTVDSRPVYPNESATYDGSKEYNNPLSEGRVTITVHSRYYEAWAEYFRTRSDGTVTVYDSNKSVTLELVALRTYGDFTIPLEGNDLVFRGLKTHQVNEFRLTLFDDDDDSAEFSNLDWSLYADQGSKQFEINVVDASGGNCGEAARVSIFYTNGSDTYQSWTNGSAYTYECEPDGTDWNNDGDNQDKRLILNFTKTTRMAYEPVRGDDADILYYKSDVPSTFQSPVTFEGHPNYGEPTTYSEGETAPVRNVTNHYMALMGPEVRLTVYDQNSDSIEERISTGHVQYGGNSDLFLTYLHVTENRINVTLR